MKHSNHSKKDLIYRNAKPKEREYAILDGDGLSMIVLPTGGKYWIYRYSIGGKRSKIHLGSYPDVPLRGYLLNSHEGVKTWIKGARDSAEDFRRLVASGIDPKKVARVDPQPFSGSGVVDSSVTPVVQTAELISPSSVPIAKVSKTDALFRTKAEEWFKVQSKGWSQTNILNVQRRLEKDILPVIGNKPVGMVDEEDALNIFNTITDRNADVLAVRVVEYIERILRFSGCDGFKIASLRERGFLIRRRPVRHHPARSRKDQFAELLRKVDAVESRESLKLGIKLLALSFCRPGALQKAEWAEIDFRRSEWIIPGDRAGCKRKKYQLDEPHLVPLSRQAIVILRRLKELSARSRYVFPSKFRAEESISNAAFGNFLKQLGFKNLQTPHGFRACARTLMREELQIPTDVIGVQLGHASSDRNGRSYDRAEFLYARHEAMQRWADFIDKITAQRAGVLEAAWYGRTPVSARQGTYNQTKPELSV